MTEGLQERMRRLLLLVPYVIKGEEVTVQEACDRFGITREQLMHDLDLLFVCGRPGYGPGDLIEAFVDGDQIHIRMAEYFSKPLRITATEGLLLYAGGKALLSAGAGDDALERAVDRLAILLGPEAVEGLSLDMTPPAELAQLRKALDEHKRVHLRYHSGSKDEMTERDVDPWGVFAAKGHWYLVGWCHLVEDDRIFRVDRIHELTVLKDIADVPEDFTLSRYDSLYVGASNDEEVTIDMAPGAGEWFADYYPLKATEQRKGGWTRITLSVGGAAWLERLLLRLGAQAKVVTPKELQERVRDLACRVAEKYR